MLSGKRAIFTATGERVNAAIEELGICAHSPGVGAARRTKRRHWFDRP
ncbi:hypothetical protein ACLB1Q_04455 [Escherichia coli]